MTLNIEITKQIKVKTTIDSKDMGIAFADATQEEQVDFIVAAVKEFNSWHGLDTDIQIARICDEILQSEHRQEIESFMELMMHYYNYCKSTRKDNPEVTM